MRVCVRDLIVKSPGVSTSVRDALFTKSDNNAVHADVINAKIEIIESNGDVSFVRENEFD